MSVTVFSFSLILNCFKIILVSRTHGADPTVRQILKIGLGINTVFNVTALFVVYVTA